MFVLGGLLLGGEDRLVFWWEDATQNNVTLDRGSFGETSQLQHHRPQQRRRRTTLATYHLFERSSCALFIHSYNLATFPHI
jgi:hypothetical protein